MAVDFLYGQLQDLGDVLGPNEDSSILEELESRESIENPELQLLGTRLVHDIQRVEESTSDGSKGLSSQVTCTILIRIIS